MAKKKNTKLPAHKRIDRALYPLMRIQSDVNNLRIDCNNRENYACGIALQHIWEQLQELEETLKGAMDNGD